VEFFCVSWALGESLFPSPYIIIIIIIIIIETFVTRLLQLKTNTSAIYATVK